MKEKVLLKKKNIIQLIGFIFFMLLISSIFSKVTYLFRNVGCERNHMISMGNEKLDMIYIGGSAAFVYWEPLKAWHDCGFTSYSYATSTIQAENIEAYIKEARKTQNPDLFVIGVRAFQYYSDDPNEGGLRNGTDGMDLTSLARYELLNDYFTNRNMPEDSDILSYYFDIAKYHTNTENLSSSEAWGYINNKGKSPYKGWEWCDLYGYLDTPLNFETEERAELPENAVKILKKLLDYCKKEKLKVLFVVCPYYITMEEEAKYNTIGDIIKSYGFDFLNANHYYDEMKIDFSTDFYNKNHVNLFGAEKYTQFLEEYLTMKYQLPDHRDDSNYDSWNDDYQRFYEEHLIHEDIVTKLRLDVEAGKNIEVQMRSTENLAEWYALANDPRYKLLITKANSIGLTSDMTFKKILHSWELNEVDSNQMRVIQDSQIAYSNASENSLVFDGTAGVWNDISYRLSVENKTNTISVDGQEVISGQDGINVVVFDNNYRYVADAVFIKLSDGQIQLVRE